MTIYRVVARLCPTNRPNLPVDGTECKQIMQKIEGFTRRPGRPLWAGAYSGSGKVRRRFPVKLLPPYRNQSRRRLGSVTHPQALSGRGYPKASMRTAF